MKLSLFFGLLLLVGQAWATPTGKVTQHTLHSKALAGNLVGVDPARHIRVYTPPGYDPAKHRYPVIYYLHSFGRSPDQLFTEDRIGELLDSAIGAGQIKPVILVAGDFTTNTLGSFYGNASSSGRWLDHIRDELVPFVDSQHASVASAEGRGISGDMIGGYAALKLAMLNPELFSSVYALHPVGTATGETLMRSRPDWAKMNNAKSWQDLAGDGYSQVFMMMAQAYLPNPNKPPFYADLMVELVGGEIKVNGQNTTKLQRAFLLDQLVPEHVENLHQLKGIAFDWGRLDANPDHVYANQKFTRLLADYGIQHTAEEHGGNHWDQHWGENGRFTTRLLPFFNRHLVFSATQNL